MFLDGWLVNQKPWYLEGDNTHTSTPIQTRPIIYRLALVSNNRLVSVIYQYKPQSRPLCQQSELISPRNHLTVKVLSAQIEEVNTLKPWAWYLNTPLYGLNNSKSNLYPYMCTGTYFLPSIIFFLLAFCHQTHNDIWLSCASLIYIKHDLACQNYWVMCCYPYRQLTNLMHSMYQHDIML